MEINLDQDLVQTVVFAFFSVIIFIVVAKIFGFSDIKAEKANKCSKCRKVMSKPEEIASLKYKQEDAFKGKYFCEECLSELLKNRYKKVRK